MSVAYEAPTDWNAHYRAVRARLYAKTTKTLPAQKSQPEPVPTPCPKRDIINLYREGSAIIYAYPVGPEREITQADKARRILAEVAFRHGFGVNDVKSQRREKALVRCREEACWRLRNETTWSLPHIGKFMGGRDHTSILWSVRKHQSVVDALTGANSPATQIVKARKKRVSERRIAALEAAR